MSRIEILEERCKGCLLCTEACPKQLIRRSEHFNRHGYLVAEFSDESGSSCTGCASCAVMCPDVAIRVYRTQKSGKGDKA
ncbi:MAG: ferredoxin family protein [Desulfovibrionaceae bacterium]|nr:ferredoxin family protein [Desulfovibrionaceae bacterium]MBO4793904.1 ferredoxin family protein [Deltaproteobacteria bacterium]MBR5733968.1 ferredoxin family protein [Desulfovibrionaceae bacterium]